MGYSRVAVIGASGFIGRYVVQRLAAKGAVIAAIMRDIEAGRFLQPMGDVGQIARIRASLLDEARLAQALAGAEAVVNLAGILYERGAQRFVAVHHEGPARLGRLAKTAGVKHLVHISALAADAASPSAYARSKAAGEAALRDAFPEAVILRPSVVFGPEDDFFNRFAALAQVAPALPLIGGGRTRFQPVYVGDVADAVVRALDDPKAAGRTYELGGPAIYTFRELMKLLLNELGRRRLLVNLPWSLAKFEAAFLEWLPTPPLTRDQVSLLTRDSVVSEGALTLKDLGITPTPVESILPSYMDRYRRGGRFGNRRTAA
ncbi:MAG TPA: complex I NDUFA9 subunit family protein [Stellaceae bacterium]|nr:complex I NDUFA9 subunit family protein [Stellaceae bacterium]